MKIFSLTLCAVLLASFSALAAPDEAVFDRIVKDRTIRCGYFSWPPYIIKDAKTGAFSGINYDIMEAIGKNLDLKIEWTAEIGVGDVVAALETNKIDMVCASLWPNAARMQSLTLSTPSFYSVVHAFVRAGDKRFDGDLAKANDKAVKVAAIEGDITQNMANEKLPRATAVILPQTASGSELLLQLTTKKADIVLLDQGLVNDFLKTNPGSLRRVEGIPPVHVFGEHLAVKRGEYQLKAMIDNALLQLTNDGIVEGMAKKYAAQFKLEILPPLRGFSAGP